MFEHPDYEIGALVEETGNFQICHAKRKHDDLDVYLKTTNSDHPPLKLLAVLQHEYEVLKQLDEPEIIHALDYEVAKHNAAIVLEDVHESAPLQELIKKGALPIDQFLPIALQITKAINKIHRAHIINKDINPHNIIILPDKQHIKLINFSVASFLTREKQEVTNPLLLEGDLAFISPEQTGRMNRKVDYRTDLYSMGITFYTMLTGRLPFEAEDPMELVHCHIARQPVAPKELNPEIPETLSNLVLKLMAKTPEERYQSAIGIEKDLLSCYKQWKKNKHVEPFELGKFDVVETFQISDRLYGRDKEITFLMGVFDSVAKGSCELLFVPGYSGVGKTRLVSEIYKPITEKRGYFISGKFEQFKQNIPYSAIGQAFSELIKQVLSEPSEKLKEWREKITKAVGINGQVLVDLMPDLELIIGKQKPVQQLGPNETQVRLFTTFEAFIKVFASEDHPLVVFLDDLQWSNIPTLRLIQYCIAQSSATHLLLIGSYRDNEVTKGHPLLLVASEIEKIRPISYLHVKALDEQSMGQLIADTLLHSKEAVEELAKIIYDKAKGNPFFTIELLKNLYQTRHFRYNHQKGVWQWDIDKVRQAEISDNVVEFLLERVNKLPQETQKLLQIAACCGAMADLNTLEKLAGFSRKKLSIALWPALQNEFLVPVSSDYRLITTEREEGNKICNINALFKFSHDRLQQASYQLMTRDEQQRIHREIALAQLLKYSKADIADHIIDIVGQYNKAVDLIESTEEKIELAKMNLQAAKRAKGATAYDYALHCLKVAKGLLPKNAWQAFYPLNSEVHYELTLCAFLAGEFDLSKETFEVMLNELKTDVEKAKVYLIQTMVHLTAGRLLDSLQYALKGLTYFGIYYTEDVKENEYLQVKQNLESKLKKYKIKDLLDLPLIKEPGIPILMELLSATVTVCYVTGRSFLGYTCICKGVELSLEYGNSPQACVAYTTFGGIVLIPLEGDIERGYQFGKLAINLNKKLDDVALRCKVYCLYATFNCFWKENWRHQVDWFKRAIDAGNIVGDKRYIGYSCLLMQVWQMEGGVDPTLDLVKRYLPVAESSNFQGCILSLYLIRQFLFALQGSTENSQSLTDENIQEASLVDQLTATKFTVGTAIYNILKLILSYMFGKYEEAVDYSVKIEPLIHSILGTPLEPAYRVFKFLASCANFANLQEQDKEKNREILTKQLQTVQLWASHQEENFLPMQHIMEGELARLELDVKKAIKCFEKAIISAQESGMIRFEALANELAAKALINNQEAKLATAYMVDALYAYQLWGAHNKVKQLREYYGKINPYTQTLSQTLTSGLQTISGGLDYLSILKASQSISSSLQLEALIKEITVIMLENSGAEKGFLLLEKNKELFVESEAAINEQPEVLQHIPLEEKQDLCQAIIQYVYRTKERLVLNNAVHHATFGNDEYIKKNKPKSILCAPIKRKNELIGIFYFENNLVTNAFTSERLEILELFSSQAAISLENARFYTVYERFVPKQFLKLLQKRSLVDVELGDSVEQEISVLFTDMRNFTTLLQKRSPQESFNLVNRYWNYMAPVIRRHQGFIIHFIGDALVALFSGKADDAARASLGLLEALKEFNENQAKLGEMELEMGIGIETGLAMLGIIGEENRLDQGIISDSTNTASRVEALNKLYRTHILISSKTKEELKNPDQFPLRRIDKVILKGQENAIYLYELMDWGDQLDQRDFEVYLNLFDQAFGAYEKGNFEKAVEIFKQCRGIYDKDGVVDVLTKRCNTYLTEGPPPNWDGTYILLHK